MNAILKIEFNGSVLAEIPVELAATDAVEFSMLPVWAKAALINEALKSPPPVEVG